MKVVLFEDESASDFLPLVFLRPVFELLCGALTLRQKVQELFADSELHLEVRPELAEVAADAFGTGALNHPERLAPDDDMLIVNAAAVLTGAPEGYRQEERACAAEDGAFVWAFLTAETVADMEADSAQELAGLALDQFGSGACEDLLMRRPWDLVEHNPDQIERDWAAAYADRPGTDPGPDVAVLGSRDAVFIAEDACVEPCAVLDCRRGPIIIEAGAAVRAHSTVEGPAFVGPGVQVRGAHVVAGCSLGERSELSGHFEQSILQGHCAQTGPGYVGHSYLGEWVQIGPSAAGETP
ncbi:MAG: putative sugar nucleotidyl transferase [Candidatus Brocadiia bacterium]